jgi:WD40 repeat protein
MSRMTRAEFLRVCTAGYLAIGYTSQQLHAATASNASLPRLHAQRVIEHLAEKPTDRAPVVTSVALSPNSEIIATAGDDHLVRLWQMSTGELKHLLREHTDWVRSASFDPTGMILATAGEDRVVRLWDVQQGKLIKTMTKHALGIRSVRFSPDGKTLAAAGFDEQVAIYDVEQGQTLQMFEAPCPDMRAVAFSRTGDMLAAGGRDGRLRLYRTLAANETPTVSAHTQRLRALSFSPDGSMLATAGEDQQVLVWNLQTVKPLHQFAVTGSKIMSLAWCGPQVIAAGGTDNQIHLLDLKTQQIAAILIGHTGTIATLDADPVGRLLVSGSFDTTARVWNIEQIVHGSTTAKAPVLSTEPRTSQAPETNSTK